MNPSWLRFTACCRVPLGPHRSLLVGAELARLLPLPAPRLRFLPITSSLHPPWVEDLEGGRCLRCHRGFPCRRRPLSLLLDR
eukprot:15419196-Heterocapsa_arctica.AAC.1